MSEQLAFAGLHSPADHGQLLHGGKRHGTVLIWQQQKSKKQWIKVEPQHDLAQVLSEQFGHPDRYMGVNEFDGWRLVKLLRSLRALFVDLDEQRDIFAVLDALQRAGLSEPTLYVESGRGLHLYWLLEPVPPKALPVWQAVQDRLIEVLTPLGADSSARDCTRVLRIVGSMNGKNGEEVRGWILSNRVWTLREISAEVLGPRKQAKPAPISTLHAARAKRQMGVAQKTAHYRLWHSRYTDLCLIADHHAFMAPDGLQEGCRDKMLFLLGVALSWFAAPEALIEEVGRIAKTYTPTLEEAEIAEYTRPLLERADRAARGELIEWDGQMVDPRYRFRTETLRKWLGGLITPELEPQLLVLGPPKSPEEQAAARAEREKSRSRVQEGRYAQTRPAYIARSTERAQEAQRLHTEGLTAAEIAERLGVSLRSVRYYVQCKVRPSCIAPAG